MLKRDGKSICIQPLLSVLKLITLECSKMKLTSNNLIIFQLTSDLSHWLNSFELY